MVSAAEVHKQGAASISLLRGMKDTEGHDLVLFTRVYLVNQDVWKPTDDPFARVGRLPRTPRVGKISQELGSFANGRAYPDGGVRVAFADVFLNRDELPTVPAHCIADL